MPRRGEQFEKAVFEFYRGLDPHAEVHFDHRVMDRDTGAPRQVDVWVQYHLFGHLPITVLISCKDHSRPLDVGEIETLLGEVKSTGANMGVLYARRGFTTNALAKAKANNVSCCRLFDNAPPEIPSELLLEAYVAHPVYRVMAVPAGDAIPDELCWSDVLCTSDTIGESQVPVAELLAALCWKLYHSSVGQTGGEPLDMVVQYQLKPRPQCPGISVHLALTWDWFKGRMNAYAMTGSLNVTAQSFVGSAGVGPIPLQSTPSLSSWERCPPPPAVANRVRVTVRAIAGPDPRQIERVMAGHAVTRGPWVFGSPTPQRIDQVIQQTWSPLAVGLEELRLTAEFKRAPK